MPRWEYEQQQPLFKPLPKEFHMSAPYTVEITVKNAAGTELTLLRQRVDEYWALVEYQKALAAGIFNMADEAVKLKSADKKG